MLSRALVDHEFASNYNAWEHLGSIMSSVARGMGFSLSEEGLWQPARTNGNFTNSRFPGKKPTLLTGDFDRAISFLGYDDYRFHQGFSSRDEVFLFAASSPYFREDHLSRRDPNHKAFIEWLDAGFFSALSDTLEHKDCINRATEYFLGAVHV